MPPHRVDLSSGFAALCQMGCTAGRHVSRAWFLQFGRDAAQHEPSIVISTRTTSARAVTAKGGTKVHAATIILHDSHWSRVRAPARKGVKAAPDSGIEA